jgi:hypothetical protein
MEAAMTSDTSLLQILAAADMADEEDVAVREGLFEALRNSAAIKAAIAKSDARNMRARPRLHHPRHGAPRGVTSSRGTPRLPCTFRR